MCQGFNVLEKDPRDIILEDLSFMLRMIITKFERGKLDQEYLQKVSDYLQRKGLQGSILRSQG